MAEGLDRNHNLFIRPRFALAYWADVLNAQPIALEELGQRYEKAAGQGPLPRYDPTAVDRARAVAQKWGGQLFDMEKQLYGLGVEVEGLIGVKFDDLEQYYASQDIRDQICSRLSNLLQQHQDKRIMLIGHSMGSIVSYDVLRTYDESMTVNIKHFVTIGAPLGLPIVAHKIRAEFGETRTPKNVQRWTNLADPGDKVALDCNLADEYEAYNGIHVTDVLAHNDYVNDAGETDCHKSYGYLRAPEVSDLVRDFLQSDADDDGAGSQTAVDRAAHASF